MSTVRHQHRVPETTNIQIIIDISP